MKVYIKTIPFIANDNVKTNIFIKINLKLKKIITCKIKKQQFSDVAFYI